MKTHPAVDQPVFQGLIISLGHEVLSTVVTDFGRHANNWLRKMKAAEDASDAERVRFSLHGLSSSSAAIGALELARLSRMPGSMGSPAEDRKTVANLLRVGAWEISRFQKDALLLISADKSQKTAPRFRVFEGRWSRKDFENKVCRLLYSATWTAVAGALAAPFLHAGAKAVTAFSLTPSDFGSRQHRRDRREKNKCSADSPCLAARGGHCFTASTAIKPSELTASNIWSAITFSYVERVELRHPNGDLPRDTTLGSCGERLCSQDILDRAREG